MDQPSQPTEDAAPDRAKPSRARSLIHRLIALAVLGSAIALAVVTVTNAIRHEAKVELLLPSGIRQTLDRLELAVWEVDQDGPPAVVTIMPFSEEHRPAEIVEHTFSLPNGRYELEIKLYDHPNAEQIRVRKPLEVSGDATIRYRLS